MREWSLAGSLVWQARTAAGLSQRALAAACGVPQSTIAVIEGGSREPSIPLLLRILRGAGMDLTFRLEPIGLTDEEQHSEALKSIFREGAPVAP